MAVPVSEGPIPYAQNNLTNVLRLAYTPLPFLGGELHAMHCTHLDAPLAVCAKLLSCHQREATEEAMVVHALVSTSLGGPCTPSASRRVALVVVSASSAVMRLHPVLSATRPTSAWYDSSLLRLKSQRSPCCMIWSGATHCER
eukprot:6185157-Pleurochrysis_carterae.AAC.1